MTADDGRIKAERDFLRGVRHAGLMTRVSSLDYDFVSRTGTLKMPPDCSTDMAGAIALFEGIDPHVERIVTVAGGVRDTEYVLIHGKTATWQVAR